MTLHSCVIYNSTKHKDSDICNLHNEKMSKALVRTIYGRACGGNSIEYPNAKRMKCMGCLIRTWPNRRLAVIYHCKSCDKVKRTKQEQTESNLGFTNKVIND